MRIAVCPSDREAVGHYRLGLPCQTLADQDETIHTTFLPGLPLNTVNGEPIGVAHEHFDYDALILQRPTQTWQLTAIQDLQAHGTPVMVEIDDNLHRINPRNTAAQHLTRSHLDTLAECCRIADLVTVSAQALADRYAPHGRYRVLHNYVPEAWCDIHASQDGDVVGWTGTVASHAGDLQATSGGVARAIHANHARFRVIGRPERVQRELQLDHEPEHVTWQTRDQYPHQVARLDIGIAPLAASQFNACKSWLKPLEYAALGVPCITSPTVEYKRLHDEYGIGLLAAYRTDWQHHTNHLLADPSHRHEIAQQGRQAVRDHLTIESNAWRFAEAWSQVTERV